MDSGNDRLLEAVLRNIRANTEPNISQLPAQTAVPLAAPNGVKRVDAWGHLDADHLARLRILDNELKRELGDRYSLKPFSPAVAEHWDGRTLELLNLAVADTKEIATQAFERRAAVVESSVEEGFRQIVIEETHKYVWTTMQSLWDELVYHPYVDRRGQQPWPSADFTRQYRAIDARRTNLLIEALEECRDTWGRVHSLERPIEIEIQSNKERVEKFLEGASAIALRRLTKTHFWRACGYTDRTVFQHWQTGTGTPEGKRLFEQKLQMSPEEFVDILRRKRLIVDPR